MKTTVSPFPSIRVLLATLFAASFLAACAKQESSATSTPSTSEEAATPDGQASTESQAASTEATPAAPEGENATPQQ
jgi:nitrous oxide reductase accessory protein NosL